MTTITPYSTEQADTYVVDAIRRTKEVHKVWRQLEHLYAVGDERIDTPTARESDLLKELMTMASLERANLVLPHLNIIIASVSERVPQFVVEPLLNDGVEDLDDAEAAKAAEDLLKYYWRRSNATQCVADMTKDLVVLGPAFCKVGWVHQDYEVDRDVRSLLDDEEAGLQDIPLTEMVTLVDEPFIEYVRPSDVFVSPGARDLRTARWVAQRVRKPEDEIREEFDLEADFRLIVDTEDQKDLDGLQPDTYNPVYKVCTLVEFYDQRTKTMRVFQLGGEELWAGPTPTPDGLAPFVMMRNYRRSPSDFYGFGDLLNIAPLQVMLNESFTLQMDNLRRTGSFVIIDEDVLDRDLADSLEVPEPGKIVPVKLGNKLIRDSVMPFEVPPLNQDVYTAGTVVQDLMAQVLGLSDFQRGLSGANRMSGTAAAAVEGHSSLRAAEKQATIARAIGEIGEKILALAAEYMSDDLTVKVAGADGPTVREISTNHIQGDHLVTVDAGSVAAINPETRKQRALEKANVLVPLLSQAGYDPEPILRQVLRDYGEDADQLLRKQPPQEAPAAPMPQDTQPIEPPVDPMRMLTGNPQDLVGGLASEVVLPNG